jgi:hypothetical protein
MGIIWMKFCSVTGYSCLICYCCRLPVASSYDVIILGNSTLNMALQFGYTDIAELLINANAQLENESGWVSALYCLTRLLREILHTCSLIIT